MHAVHPKRYRYLPLLPLLLNTRPRGANKVSTFYCKLTLLFSRVSNITIPRFFSSSLTLANDSGRRTLLIHLAIVCFSLPITKESRYPVGRSILSSRTAAL
jgi:hypothetical protein